MWNRRGGAFPRVLGMVEQRDCPPCRFLVFTRNRHPGADGEGSYTVYHVPRKRVSKAKPLLCLLLPPLLLSTTLHRHPGRAPNRPIAGTLAVNLGRYRPADTRPTVAQHRGSLESVSPFAARTTEHTNSPFRPRERYIFPLLSRNCRAKVLGGRHVTYRRC
jgi:hypothetical protein